MNTGITIYPVPTGFGGYTGIYIINNGDSMIDYTVDAGSASFTNLSGSESPDPANCIFISNSSNHLAPTRQLKFTLAPRDQELVSVYHKAFTGVLSGVDSCVLTVSSKSYDYGESDPNPSYISVTGQRLVAAQFPAPLRVGSFYSYPQNSSLVFNWKTRLEQNFITGFKLDTGDSTAFGAGSFISYTIPVSTTTSDAYPLYGNYSGLIDKIFSYTVPAPINTNCYARLTSINPSGSQSQVVYCSGAQSYNPILSCVVKNGYTGSNSYSQFNLKVPQTTLVVNVANTTAENFDLYNYIATNYSVYSSTSFAAFSGISVNFYDSIFKSKDSDYTQPAISFQPPSTITFPTVSPSFNIEMNFYNCSVYGKGGLGGTKSNPVPTDGGSLLGLKYINGVTFYVNADSLTDMVVGGCGTQGANVSIATSTSHAGNTTYDSYNIDGQKGIDGSLVSDISSVNY